MILVDANILLYAYDAASDRQQQARDWLEETLSGTEAVGLPWSVLLAFLRLGTSPAVYQRPLTMKEAVEIIARWLETAGVVVLEPTDRHWAVLRSLLSRAQVRGPAVTDAHLAALALEHGATLCTTDRGFARFPGLKMLDPLEAR